jgi:hypothetical protein
VHFPQERHHVSLSAKVWVKESTLLRARLGMSLELPRFS